MIDRLENFAYDARVTIGKELVIIEPAADWFPFVSTAINVIEFVVKGVLLAVEDQWEPSREVYPLLYHIAKKDIWKRSLPGLVPVFGNIYVIYQDVCNHLEQRKKKSAAIKKSIVNEKIPGSDRTPCFDNNVRSTRDFEGKVRLCGDYGVFLRNGKDLFIAVCLDGKSQDKCIDSFLLKSIQTDGKEYFSLCSREHFCLLVDEVYSYLLFPNKDRIVSHITDETCIKFGPWQELRRPNIRVPGRSPHFSWVMTEIAKEEIGEIPPTIEPTDAFHYCKIGDLLVEEWPTQNNSDGVVHLKISKEEAKLIKIDDLRDALKDNRVKGPAVEKFIEIWQRKINALSEPNS